MNCQLLEALRADPRVRTSDLARSIGMSAPAVAERLGRLEQAGVIRGYRLDLDPAALGLPVSAWVRVRPGPGQLPKISELARTMPEVSECHRVTGEDCFLARVHVASIEDLERVLDQFLVYGNTTSSIIVTTTVPPRGVPIPTPKPSRSRRADSR